MANETTLKTRHVQKHDIEANWILAGNASKPFIPLKGEIIIYDPDTSYLYSRFKIGDGETAINELPFASQVDKLIIGEGEVNSIGIAGGTTDKSFAASIVGNTLANMANLAKSEAIGDCSIAIGANNIANSAGGMALGYDNITGVKGNYLYEIIYPTDNHGKPTGESTTWVRIGPWPTRPHIPSWENGFSGSEDAIRWDNGYAIGDKLLIYIGDDVYEVEVEDYESQSMDGQGEVKLKSLPFSSADLALNLTGNPMHKMVVHVNNPMNGAKPLGWGGTAIGAMNKAYGSSSLTYGYKNTADAEFGIAFGQENIVGNSAFTAGLLNNASGKGSAALGKGLTVSGEFAFAEGADNTASGVTSHAEGRKTVASADATHTEGYNTKATKFGAHAEGGTTEANGEYSHAEGAEAKANGKGSHAEGYSTEANANWAHAEGWEAIASGAHAHAEGSTTEASGISSHAEGWNTYTGPNAEGAHAEGWQTQALHNASHAGGYQTKTSADYQTVIGTYNEDDADAVFIVGNGDGDNTGPYHNGKENAFVVKKNGDVYAGNYKVVTEYTLQSLLDKISSLENTINELDARLKYFEDKNMAEEIKATGEVNLTNVANVEANNVLNIEGASYDPSNKELIL